MGFFLVDTIRAIALSVRTLRTPGALDLRLEHVEIRGGAPRFLEATFRRGDGKEFTCLIEAPYAHTLGEDLVKAAIRAAPRGTPRPEPFRPPQRAAG